MVEIPYNKIIEFLRGIVPFNELPREVLSGLPQKISIDYFPRESLILKQDGSSCDYLYIIQTGAVEKTVRKDDIFLEYKAENDFFGSASLINRTGPEFNVRAYEDTVCYLLPRETFDELMQNHAGFHEYFALRYFCASRGIGYSDLPIRRLLVQCHGRRPGQTETANMLTLSGNLFCGQIDGP
ncbi:MAG: cyclic nucleotide-binding domain-containing protein [Deltaproteobacteria bacterium]|nr:cyclic nucleotide-binding domain-containing protein [Deltaproteobacteria bacterium]